MSKFSFPKEILNIIGVGEWSDIIVEKISRMTMWKRRQTIMTTKIGKKK